VNAPAADSSRRRFLTRLFQDPAADTATTELSPQPDLHRHTEGVLWAAATDNQGTQFVAGDDGMVFRCEDNAWKREDFPSTLPVHSLAISGDTLYCVGWMGLICERSGGAWHRIQGGGGEAGIENLPLFDIESDSEGGLWAVGDQGRIVHFGGGDWHEQKSGTTANLRCVLPLNDGRVLVAGSGGTALIGRRDEWAAVETNTGCPVVSMAQLGDDSVIAVGGEYDIETGTFQGRIFLFKDDQWQRVESEHSLPRLRKVRKAGDSLLICGDDGTAFRWTAEGASRLRTRLRHDLHDILCLDDGRVLICGDGGTLLHETEASARDEPQMEDSSPRWHQISNEETNRTLRAIWPVGEDQLIAAGDGGTVLHIQGDEITVRKTPQELRIHDLWGSTPKNVFAVCDNATILHFNGDDWDIAHQGKVDTALLAVTGFGAHDIFAVGDSGYALRYDGLMWRQLETGVQQELYALWGQDSQHLLAVGGGGLVLRFNGEQWKTFSAGTDQDLYGVYGSGLEKLFIAGLAGTLIRFEDNAWHRDFSGVRSDLHAVTGSDGTYYAVGSNGTILRNTDSVWESEQSGCNNTLQAIATSAISVYAVGSGGIVLRKSR